MILLFLRNITPRVWLAFAVIVLALFVLGQCIANGHRSAADGLRRAEAGQTMAEGRTAAASDASAIRDGNDLATHSTREQVKEAHDALSRENDPAVRDADARRRLCALNPGACAP